MNNKLFKIISSIPVILLVLYFIPFLGVCLLIFRYFIYKKEKSFKTPITLVILGLILLIPNIINSIIKSFKLNIDIPFLNEIINSEIYPNIINYSKLLITLGIIFLIVSYIINMIITKVESTLNTELNKYVEEEHNRSQENDLKIKEKQERAKHTHAVHCPKCGAVTIITSDTGVCKFCRSPIEYKD